MDYYSAVKRKEVLIPATMWMNLEDILLNEIIHTPKDNSDMNKFICVK